MDEIIEEYKKDIDRTLIRYTLRMTVGQRVESHQQMARFREELIAAKKRTAKQRDESK
jgi:hypothetical protein